MKRLGFNYTFLGLRGKVAHARALLETANAMILKHREVIKNLKAVEHELEILEKEFKNRISI